ncbi:hypothetical protein EMCRGX_G027780 [Ephydatia muelleri]
MSTRRTLPRPTSVVDERVLHEGWCVKESGTALFGQTNWRRRWFRLVQFGQTTYLRYYKSQKDKSPAGSFKLDVTYCTRQLENGEKSHLNCFAVGPLLDDGASRTYYISCSTPVDMQEWMTSIDAVIQGVPEQVQVRRETIRKRCGRRSARDSATDSNPSDPADLDLMASCSLSMADDASFRYSVEQSVRPEVLTADELLEDMDMDMGEEGAREISPRVHQTVDSGLSASGKMDSYHSARWRLERFKDVCQASDSVRWTHEETKDDVTLSRSTFGGSRNGMVVLKVEGVLRADPSTVYQFLQLSTKEGGKLDYIFRNETLLNSFEADEPRSSIIYNQLLLPIPRISKRDVVALKAWVPAYLSRNGCAGFVMVSVDYPEAPPLERGCTRMHVNPSGIVLSPHAGEGGALHTRAVIIVQVAFYGGLHTLVKGAYNSGLLKIGLRTTFSHIATELQKFVDITNI